MTIVEVEKMFLDCRFDEAFDEFRKLADEGEPRAFYFMGEYYAWGYGHIYKDRERAAFYRKKGYELNDILAGLNHAFSYSNGDSIRDSIFKEMVPQVIELAEKGDVFAQNELADCYSNGYAVEQSIAGWKKIWNYHRTGDMRAQ